MISLKQSMEFGKSAYTQFDNPDFVKLAESFGGVGYKVKSAKEFSTVLGKAKESKFAPVIIAVDVDYSGNYRLLEGSKDNP